MAARPNGRKKIQDCFFCILNLVLLQPCGREGQIFNGKGPEGPVRAGGDQQQPGQYVARPKPYPAPCLERGALLALPHNLLRLSEEFLVFCSSNTRTYLERYASSKPQGTCSPTRSTPPCQEKTSGSARGAHAPSNICLSASSWRAVEFSLLSCLTSTTRAHSEKVLTPPLSCASAGSTRVRAKVRWTPDISGRPPGRNNGSGREAISPLDRCFFNAKRKTFFACDPVLRGTETQVAGFCESPIVGEGGTARDQTLKGLLSHGTKGELVFGHWPPGISERPVGPTHTHKRESPIARLVLPENTRFSRAPQCEVVGSAKTGPFFCNPLGALWAVGAHTSVWHWLLIPEWGGRRSWSFFWPDLTKGSLAQQCWMAGVGGKHIIPVHAFVRFTDIRLFVGGTPYQPKVQDNGCHASQVAGAQNSVWSWPPIPEGARGLSSALSWERRPEWKHRGSPHCAPHCAGVERCSVGTVRRQATSSFLGGLLASLGAYTAIVGEDNVATTQDGAARCPGGRLGREGVCATSWGLRAKPPWKLIEVDRASRSAPGEVDETFPLALAWETFWFVDFCNICSNIFPLYFLRNLEVTRRMEVSLSPSRKGPRQRGAGCTTGL